MPWAENHPKNPRFSFILCDGCVQNGYTNKTWMAFREKDEATAAAGVHFAKSGKIYCPWCQDGLTYADTLAQPHEFYVDQWSNAEIDENRPFYQADKGNGKGEGKGKGKGEGKGKGKQLAAADPASAAAGRTTADLLAEMVGRWAETEKDISQSLDVVKACVTEMGQNQTLTAAMVSLHWNVQHLLQQSQDYAGLMTELNRKQDLALAKQDQLIADQLNLIQKLKRRNQISQDGDEVMADLAEAPTSDQTAAAAAAPTAAAAAAPTVDNWIEWTCEGPLQEC